MSVKPETSDRPRPWLDGSRGPEADSPSAPEPRPNPLRDPWYVARDERRAIYANERLIGVMDTPEMAEYAVRAHNDAIESKGERHPWQIGCATCQHEAETKMERFRQGLETAQGEAYLGALAEETPTPLDACHNVIRACQEALR